MDRPPATVLAAAPPTPGDEATAELTAPAWRSTVVRVYRLLRDGMGARRAAEVLGVSRQTVYKHAANLLKDKALQVIPGTHPRVFERGPKARYFEAWHASGRDRAGSQPPVRGVRAHNWQFKWSYAGEPEREPPWGRTWEASGVRNARVTFEHEGRVWRVEDRRGRARSLNLVLDGDEWEWDTDRLQRLAKDVQRAAARAGRAFAARHGYTLTGTLKPVGTPHYATGVDRDVPKEGVSEQDKEWVDGSHPGPGKKEYETVEPELMARALRFDEAMREVRDEVAEANARASAAARLAARAAQSARMTRRWQRNT